MTSIERESGRDPTGAGPLPDAHGEAALLLVESLIHRLIADGALTIGTALDVIEVAETARMEIADDRGDAATAGLRSTALLSAMAQSIGFAAKS